MAMESDGHRDECKVAAIVAEVVSKWTASLVSEMLYHVLAIAIEEERERSYAGGYNQGYHAMQDEVEGKAGNGAKWQ